MFSLLQRASSLLAATVLIGFQFAAAQTNESMCKMDGQCKMMSQDSTSQTGAGMGQGRIGQGMQGMNHGNMGQGQGMRQGQGMGQGMQGMNHGAKGQGQGMQGQGMQGMKHGGMGQGMAGCPMMSANSDSTSSGGSGMMGGMKGQMQGQGMQGMNHGGMGQGQGNGQSMQGMKHGGMGQGQGNGQGMQGMNRGGMGPGKGMMMAASDSSVLAPAVVSAIDEALQDEFRSEALYQRVLDDHGDVLPFRNIVNAERRHSSHLIALLNSHRADVPEPTVTPANSPSFATVKDACTASVQAEIDNVAIYDRLLKGELPEDVRTTFDHLRMISQEHHLPAFKRCAGIQ